ncbi:sphingosine kinase [Aeromicrobium sp. Root495]|uniref:diacylglycerol/lipid kinase family protein n=1 Tax=Aeromicrobium sp. Root495 TaxID=1736550 RepID=UPI000700BE00|nr:YegS/Rv2252/BmrU family lipid kinase [Aeromicrobium sp. Root495]KQY59280.1 sphingosine kinase [Aeromicrobium sp. Root495]
MTGPLELDPETSHVALVVNPASGRRQGESVATQALERLRAHGLEVTRVTSHDAPSAAAGLAELLDQGVSQVVVVGGDGALHAVLPQLLAAQATVGLLPAGTGNDTARALGIPHGDPDAAIDVLLAGNVRALDVIETPDAPVLTVVASGFDSRVNERANAMTWPRGQLKYNIAMLAELRSFTPIPFTITLDGRRIEREVMLVAVGNGPSFGGGLRICEGAVMDDGLLDVVIINPVSKAKLVRVFPRLYRGTHVGLPEVEIHQVRRVELEAQDVVAYGDGERLGPLPLTAEVRPGALRVIVPAPGSPA